MEWSLTQNKLLAYHRLMRTDKPIGALLLLWPTLWALWLATPGVPPVWILAVFVAGVWLMRAAGCVVNDYADRKIDGQGERTANRPPSSGAVTGKQARNPFGLRGVAWLLRGLGRAARDSGPVAGTVAPPVAAVPAIDTGDTAWMLISTALVLMMTIRGLALFYGGMVRKRKVLATLIQSFAICCIASLVWMVLGDSLAISTGTAWIGDLSHALLRGVSDRFTNGVDGAFTLGAGSANPVPMTIPESVYLLFQMTFAIITPALITGAFAERMKFSALCVFTVLWSLLVYAPVAHLLESLYTIFNHHT